jgi:hypothetical protein
MKQVHRVKFKQRLDILLYSGFMLGETLFLYLQNPIKQAKKRCFVLVGTW